MKEIRIDVTRDEGAVSIDMWFKMLDQLFDPSDPFPFPEKELTDMAEETIFEQFVDLNLQKEVDLTLHIPKGSVPAGSENQVAAAVKHHFSFRLKDLAWEKKSSWKEGQVSVQLVVITLSLSLAVFYLYYLMPTPGFFYQIMMGIFVIINWVTIWHTWEYFVYSHRHLWRKYRVYQYITQTNVKINQTG
ncbi:MAG TPA: hypothetical protein VMC42_04640 [Methanoregulaceae archaeon]|nr:hypothetical protein [Methanoregulaceae archaeon]